MPLLVACDELRPGMSLYEPIVSNNRIMMQSGKPLTPAEIKAINRRFPGLSVRVADPVLDDVIAFEDDYAEREAATTAQQRVSKSMSTVQARFAERTSLANTDFAAVNTAVNDVMAYLRSHPASAALLTSCLDSKSYLSTHTGNVFYLSMLLASTVLDYVISERRRQTGVRKLTDRQAEDLAGLGLGAIAMDLGMMPLQALFGSDQPLTDEDRQALRDHPVVGAGMLPECFSGVARLIVRTHHENCDGSGYPAGLPGDKLHVFPRIVRIADAYDAATSERVFRSAKSPARVIWEMSKGPYRGFYDSVLMEAFVRLIQPFPIGAKLRLEDGRYAVVVKYNRIDPFRPTVAIAFDARNKPIPRSDLEAPVKLSERFDLCIRSFKGEDLSYIYSGGRQPHAAPLERFNTVLDAAYP